MPSITTTRPDALVGRSARSTRQTSSPSVRQGCRPAWTPSQPGRRLLTGRDVDRRRAAHRRGVAAAPPGAEHRPLNTTTSASAGVLSIPFVVVCLTLAIRPAEPLDLPDQVRDVRTPQVQPGWREGQGAASHPAQAPPRAG
ncbi:hypothetical protein HBB16_18130 [Pseudonocardia sp. MCCB 268]|nr:hypothetical protein [Pseudonocardia cytotoxica]